MSRLRRPAFVCWCLLALCLLGVAGAAPADAGTAVSNQTASDTVRNATPSPATDTVADSPSAAATATLQNGRTIQVTQRLQRLPARPGQIRVAVEYTLPTGLRRLTVTPPQGATVTDVSGFTAGEGAEYAWNSRTGSPALTYRLSVNDTFSPPGPISAPGELIFADVGEWALVRLPRETHSWSWTGTGTVDIARSATVEGPGVAGSSLAYLGPYDERRRTANGQTFRLVVPEQATLEASPETILDSVAQASGQLAVGPRDETVLLIAAPTDRIQWGVRGIQVGPSDFWVRDVAPVETAANTWLHEYVHTRQDYTAAADAQWFTEASATYYAALLALEQGRTDFAGFRERLAFGLRTPDRSAVLTDPSTWNVVAPYTKGALVAADLDRRLRRATDSRASLQTVFSRLNARPEPVDAATVRESLRAVAGTAVVDETTAFTATDRAPELWDQATHDAVFGQIPRINYDLDRAVTYRATGPYRNESIRPPLSVVTGEALAVDLRVYNDGDRTGTYTARLYVDGDRRDEQSGRLAPNASRTVTVEAAFDRPGTHTVSVAGRTFRVTVTEPAAPSVLAVDAEQTSRPGGARVTVTATARNTADRLAVGNLTLSREGEVVETKRVALAPDSDRTVEFDSLSLDAGTYTLSVGNRSTTVVVTAGTETQTRTASGDGPGFTPIGVLLALLAVGAVGRRLG